MSIRFCAKFYMSIIRNSAFGGKCEKEPMNMYQPSRALFIQDPGS